MLAANQTFCVYYTCYTWHTSLGALTVEQTPHGASVTLNGESLGDYTTAKAAITAIQQHATGNTTWDKPLIPVPPLSEWGQVIGAAF